MRFDDSLDTVLSADTTTSFGAQSAWRQLVDLTGRGRVSAGGETIDRLSALKPVVPLSARAASARGLATAAPPFALVKLFACDEFVVAAPVLRAAQLAPDEWIELLPDLTPAARSILRHRRDLAPAVTRALESFGPVDFILPAHAATETPGEVPSTPGDAATLANLPSSEDAAELAAARAVSTSPFVSLGSVAITLPVVAEALRQVEDLAADAISSDAPGGDGPDAPRGDDNATGDVVPLYPRRQSADGTFEIAELVARIDAYQRQRAESPRTSATPELQPELFALETVRCETFRFETDAAGIVRWVEGAAREPVIGLSLNLAARANGRRVDGVAGGAFRHRASFADARLTVGGHSSASGEWRINGIPVFDRSTGRFSGYRGTARRPRSDESAAPLRASVNPDTDLLRQLVHELRTPTNAISGFAEMIETQMLGPVPAPYRNQASTIRAHAGSLLTAIDDIDLAARIEARALDLRPGPVPLAPVLARIVGDLAPLAKLRGTIVDIADSEVVASGDDRAIERLIARLMATLIASGGTGERLAVRAAIVENCVVLTFDRPTALAAYSEHGLLTIDAETEAERDGAPLLGTGFALRLVRNLALELQGSLTIGDEALTLRLPAVVTAGVGQASYN